MSKIISIKAPREGERPGGFKRFFGEAEASLDLAAVVQARGKQGQCVGKRPTPRAVRSALHWLSPRPVSSKVETSPAAQPVTTCPLFGHFLKPRTHHSITACFSEHCPSGQAQKITFVLWKHWQFFIVCYIYIYGSHFQTLHPKIYGNNFSISRKAQYSIRGKMT